MFAYAVLGVMLVSVSAGAHFPAARLVENWPYPKLFQKADLVVIATVTSVADAGEQVKDKPPEDYLVPMLTTFEVVHVVKGEHKGKELAIVHYRFAKEDFSPPNGPCLVKFHAHERTLRTKTEVVTLGKPDYLLFLKKREDGRYECVTGQIDPIFSVKQLIGPLADTAEK